MWAKATAALLLGLPLSVGIIGLMALLWPGDNQQWVLPWLLMTFPLWVALMSWAFVFRRGSKCWLTLVGILVVIAGLVSLLKGA